MSPRLIRNAMIAIIIAVIVAASVWLFMPHQQTAATTPTKTIPTTNQPITGSSQAPLHIVAFEDLKCSNCMRFNTVILPKIMQHYVNTGRASYTVVTLAFLPGSTPAGNAALCIHAQQPHAFFEYVKKIYNNQPPETENWATVPKLMSFASDIKGINLDKLADCLVQGRYETQLQQNMQIASKVMGAQNVATPRIYVNGHDVSPLNWTQFQAVAKEAK